MLFQKLSRTAHYSLIQILYWGTYVCISSYASVYLLDRGFTNAQFGLFFAAGGLATVIVQPLLARLIDRRDDVSVRGTATVLIGIFLIATLATIVLEYQGTRLMLVPFFICMLSLYLMNPLINSLGVEGAGTYRVNFGLARGMGSFGFALVSLLLGRLVAQIGSGVILFVMAGLFALLFVTMYYFTSYKPKLSDEEQTSELSQGFFSRYPVFALIILGLICIFVGHYITANFGYQVIVDKGGDTQVYGWAIAISVLSELPPMFFYSQLEKRFSRTTMLVVSAVAFSVKIVLSYLVSTATGYLAFQPLQLLAWGLLSVNFVAYVREKIDAQDAVTGQSWFTNAQMIASIIASLAGSALIDSFGVSVLILLGALVSIVGSAIVVRAAHMRA